MPGGLTRLEQADFSAGMFRWPRHLIPPKGFYDGLDVILTDDGSAMERGGGANKSNTNVGIIDRLWSGYLKHVTDRRTVFSTTDDRFFILDPSDDATPRDYTISTLATHNLQPVEAGGVLFLTPRALYGGATAVDYFTGTADFTTASRTVVGHSTSWLANVKPGHLISNANTANTSNEVAVVKSVTDDTHLELVTPWPFATAAGASYRADRVKMLSAWRALDAAGVSGGLEFIASVGTPPRLIVSRGGTVMFSEPGDPFNIHSTSRHELPGGAVILGMKGLGDTLLVFTTSGVFGIYNMNLDLTDSFGNAQQRLTQLSDAQALSTRAAGIAAWEGGVIVPCVDDIYTFDPSGRQTKLSEAITPYYRTYSTQGYYPGGAAVVSGHYVLPILSGSSAWWDTLVCRLDRKAWTRWRGNGGTVRAYARRDGTALGEAPLLLGGVTAAGNTAANRVADLSSTLLPSGARKLDPDGTTPQFELIGRDMELGSNNPHNQVKQVRVTFELGDAASDNPTLLGYVASDAPGSSFTQLTNPQAAAPESDGGSPFTWVANKSGRRLRVKVKKGAQATAGLTLRRIELFVRQSGKQV